MKANQVKENAICFLFILAFALTEVHSVCAKIDPSISKDKVDWFLSFAYHMAMEIQWYIKVIFDNFLILVLVFISAISNKYKKVRYISFIYMAYPICDYFSFLWNYRETAEMYYVLLALTSTSSLFVIVYKPQLRAV